MPRKPLPPDVKAAYDRVYYERHRALIVADRTRRRRELGEWFAIFKQTLACARCGENDPACLDFHHRDPATKDMDLASVVHRGWSKARIFEEVAKCVVLCANCHRKLHAGRFTIDELVES
jgi:hypothetical protein